MLMLVSFSLVNLSLVRMKRRGPPPEGIWRVPAPVPMVGFVVSVAFFGYGMWDLLSR
jgi:amino acid transporter